MDPEKETKEIVEKVFKPGNLVWGTHIRADDPYDRWNGIINNGIKRTKETGISAMHLSPHVISMAILPNRQPPENYLVAGHEGPLFGGRGSYDIGIDIAIVIDTGKLIKSYPKQLLAVGEHFGSANLFKHMYDFDDKKHEVFGIPIGYRGYEMEPWSDEVRFYKYTYHDNREARTPCVRPHYWLGIVIHQDDLKEFKEINEKVGRKLNLPLVSTKCEVLDFI